MFWQTNRQSILTATPPEPAYFGLAREFALSWAQHQPHYILHTSGSTGTPQPIRLAREQLEASARATGQALQLPEGTRALVCVNIKYIAGTMMLVRGLLLNWELTIVEPAGNPLLHLSPELRFDFVAMVPLQLSQCLENEATRERVPALGKILLGGAPVSTSLLTQIRQLPTPVYQSYGMTETVSHVALRRLNGPDRHDDYTVLPGVTFGQDARGCLNVAGPMTLHERVQTNDLVEITSESTFRWLGRVDNVINSGGVKIQLEEMEVLVEQILYELGCSVEFFCWFEPDEKLGQRLVLVVKQPPAGFPAEVLWARIRERKSAYEVPRHLYFTEQYVYTPTEKIDRRRTLERLHTHKL
jgi:o-succinylbenzoate---CoA ligase